jgi:hypothetical protein
MPGKFAWRLTAYKKLCRIFTVIPYLENLNSTLSFNKPRIAGIFYKGAFGLLNV